MEIKINDKYRIISDTDNIILQENMVVQKEGNTKGKQYWKNIGYFAWLDSAYKHCLKNEIMSKEELSGVKEIIDCLERLHSDFKENMDKMS